MRYMIAAAILLLQSQKIWNQEKQAWKIADAVPLMVADLKRHPEGLRPFLRYLDVRIYDSKERQAKVAVLNGHFNSLSRQTDITKSPLIGNSLIRVNLFDYGWSHELWESLAEVDPYYHVTIQTITPVPWQGGIWHEDNKYYPPKAFNIKQETKTTAIAPWLAADQQAIKELVEMTGSKAPILRADWFFNQTAIQEGRKPGYYDFLGIKDEKTYQEIIGFDQAKADKFGKEVRESVAISGVTLQPRALVRYNTMGGGYWKSLDFKLAKDERNPLRILGRDIEKAYDATEQFGHLPNGFWATGLFDKQGKVQASAPDFIASDHRSNSNDKRVHVNAACIRCHDNGGLQDIDGWARNLFQPPLKLQSVDYYKERELRQQYFRDLKALLERDRKIFAEAVKDATGMEVKAYAKAYAQEWERYEDARVDLAWVANDLATTPEMLKKAVERDIKMQGQASDTVLSVFILEGLRQRSISIRQWEEVYPIAQMVISGYIQTQVQP